MFLKLKKYLKEEMTWLKENYPITIFENIYLKLYNANEMNDEEAEKDAFIFYDLEHKEECNIMMIAEESLKIDEADEIVIEKYKIDRGIHIYFYMLYHEYGHLIQMEKTLLESGEEALVGEMDVHIKKVEKIFEQIENGELNESEGQKLYRDLEIEKIADEFASKIYHEKKEEICKKVAEIEKGVIK